MLESTHGCCRWLTLVAVGFSALFLVGCNSSAVRPEDGKVIPRGRILENGLPVKINAANLPPGDPGMSVTFIRIGSVDAGEEIEAQIIDAEECSFELIGADAKGIAPGKYRVAISLAPVGGQDQFKGKYNREKSKIEVEVKEGEDLVIDLANYQ
jgi:hypothetical protein